DHGGERGELLDPRAVLPKVPEHLEVRDGAGHDNEVDRAVADRLVCEVDVAVGRVPDRRRVHGTRTRTDSQLVARPSSPHSTSTPSIPTSPDAFPKPTGIDGPLAPPAGP